ncbi:MAG TPA: M23 family peptidase [Flavobacteriales bacterium]|nr:M23 family peptidase [Flavobacteriales bacterium]
MKQLIGLLSVFLSFFSLGCQNNHQAENQQTKIVKDNIVKEVAKVYSYPKNDYQIIQDTVAPNDTFGKILSKAHLPYNNIYTIVQKIKDSFDVKDLKVGRPFTILSQQDSLDSIPRPKVFIYEQDPVHYTVIDFQDSIKVFNKKKKVSVKRKTAFVNIEKSLYQDIADKNLSPKLALELSNIYAWTVDFFHLNKGDAFKVIYDDVYIEDTTYVGIGNIHAAMFKYGNQDFYAFRYPYDTINKRFDYFDEEGRTLRKQFLKAPLKFGRISSRYNMHRYIKYYGRVKPHLGTDFAAPTGTPIMATANGVVIKKGYTSGNGNYIKIKHNATYSTQYLHMSKFAKGIHVGSVVKQGDIIGYVGMTGHASGPHVCYRFWKNGRQVDALKEKMPPAKPIDPKILPKYLEDIKVYNQQLDSIKP